MRALWPTCAESIEWFIEDQAFSLSMIWLIPPSPTPLSRHKLDRRHKGRLRKRDNLLTGEGGQWGEPIHMMVAARKSGPLYIISWSLHLFDSIFHEIWKITKGTKGQCYITRSDGDKTWSKHKNKRFEEISKSEQYTKDRFIYIVKKFVYS
jgi:hypothetical protein